jgi:hypothetical protein
MCRRILTSIIVVVALLSTTSCSSYRHCQWRKGDQSINDTPEYALRFIESDDEGWFWDRRQVDDTMQLIRSKASERDTIVVTFVHGWHHSAECCDGNVEGFRNTLSQLRAGLSPNFNIVGVYVGWRGRSLPWVFDYLSFWGRKGAAERVGQNDFKEFTARLQELYTEYRPDAQPPGMSSAQSATRAPKNFLGMVTIGHSFGGQVLLKAVTGSIEDQLQRLNPNPAYLRDPPPPNPLPDREFTVSGIGDLVVLINPAAEASQYHRLHLLSRGLNYSRLQTPLILTVSSENDKSRHTLFTLGRIAGEFFTGKPRKDDEVERAVEREALGVYRGHVSHLLAPVDPDVELVSTTIKGERRECRNNEPCKSEWYTWDRNLAKTEPNSRPAANLASFDFSNDVVFRNVKLSALDDATIRGFGDDPAEYAKAQPYQPFIVARVSKKVIDDHSGIFTEPFLQFLIPYIAYIEEKSKLNVSDKQERREKEDQVLKSTQAPTPTE